MDFDFLKRVTSEVNVPEFAGYNVHVCREQEQSVQPATKALYTHAGWEKVSAKR